LAPRALALVSITALAVVTRSATTAPPEDLLIVRLDAGLVRGAISERDASIRIYRGLPFAPPPVGALRWRPPSVVPAWAGVRDATRFASPCPQVERPGQAGSPVLGSEDCLYLNVWTGAATPRDRRPVLVWIHGGGMRRGSAIDPARDGSALAARGLVVVSVAYRLGPLGFFAHPLLSAESEHGSSGTYGLLDQIAALAWIRRNIEAFGGDPSRVTVFGQSGGARIVQYLQATPLARGLFHRAIAHSSGTFADRVYLRLPPPGGESAETEGERWAEAMRAGSPAGDGGGPASRPQAPVAGMSPPATDRGGALAALRALPFERVVAAVEGLTPRYAVPVDGWVLPDTTHRLFMNGRQNDVPVLLGWNANEAAAMADSAGAPSDDEGYARRIVEEFGTAAPRFEALYPPGDDPRAAFLRGYGVQTFGWSMRSWARAMATVHSPAFYYYFERAPSTPADEPGARHGAELPYVFGNLDPRQGMGAADRARSELMMAYWAAFAATGDPNGDRRPRWEPHTAAGDRTMVFGDTVAMESGVRKAELAFFDEFYACLLGDDASGAGSAVSSGAGRP
jgi:para-nitrobenzyl esterase